MKIGDVVNSDKLLKHIQNISEEIKRHENNITIQIKANQKTISRLSDYSNTETNTESKLREKAYFYLGIPVFQDNRISDNILELTKKDGSKERVEIKE
jgi:hypothetical protein